VATSEVRISHPDKLIFPEDGITKGELAAYYAAIAPLMLPHVRQRPVTMERFPSGIGEPGFLQKDVSKGFPEWLARVEVPKKGGVVHHPLVNDDRSLQWLANQNCVTAHVWTSRVPKLYQPDVCVVDLDPSIDDAVGLREAALAVRALLDELDLPSWVKTTGSKGFHIVVPLDASAGFDEVGEFTQRLAAELVRRHPDRFTLEFLKVDRGRLILVDVGRNGYSATFAAAYTVRPKPGAPVSAPCTWDEVAAGTVAPQTFNVRNMAERVAAVGELWQDLPRHARSLRKPTEALTRMLPASSPPQRSARP
jgi:bifunctional non-homologous end joining protein LigD